MNKVAALAEARPQPTSAINLPDTQVNVGETFGFDSDMVVPAYSTRTEHVPDLDAAYRFDKETTLAILAGFAFNRRVIVQGYHGTGKSTHIEQVAARINWPCSCWVIIGCTVPVCERNSGAEEMRCAGANTDYRVV